MRRNIIAVLFLMIGLIVWHSGVHDERLWKAVMGGLLIGGFVSAISPIRHR